MDRLTGSHENHRTSRRLRHPGAPCPARAPKPSAPGSSTPPCGTSPSAATTPRGSRTSPRSSRSPRAPSSSISAARRGCSSRPTRRPSPPSPPTSTRRPRSRPAGSSRRSRYWLERTDRLVRENWVPYRIALLGNYGTDLRLRQEINRFLRDKDPYGTAAFVRMGVERGEIRSDIDEEMIVSMIEWTVERFQDALLTEELDPGPLLAAGQPAREDRGPDRPVPRAPPQRDRAASRRAGVSRPDQGPEEGTGLTISDFDFEKDLSLAATIPSTWYTRSGRARPSSRTGSSRRPGSSSATPSRCACPGDYFTCTVADEPLVVTRAEDGAIHAFSNVCRHRAGPVARGSGHRKALMCGYHGWTYGLDGRLQNTPEWDGVRCFEKEKQNLPAARVETWGPFLFVCLDPAAPPLSQVLGSIPAETSHLPLSPHEPLQEGRLRGRRATGRSTSTTTSRGTTSRSSTPSSSRSSTTARTRSRPPRTTPSSTRRSARRTRSRSTGATSRTGTSPRLSTTGSSRT